MKKVPTTALFFALLSYASLAQKSSLSLERLGLKHLQLSYIPTKTFNSLVYDGSDSMSAYKPRVSSVKSFYMSRTEVTNREYREFVHYVRDSIAHQLLGHVADENNVDWKQPIDWKDKRLDEMMITGEVSYRGVREINPERVIYTVDLPGKSETIHIYPDTLVWIRDFNYSSNESLVKKYFSQAEYDDHPVVGVSLKQAMAFCQWKTAVLRQQLKVTPALNLTIVARLPSSAEWEAAAVEGRDSSIRVPRNKRYDHNFGNIVDGSRVTIKSYNDDGYYYTAPVKSYKQGPYGLYDMKGNIAEWTSTPMEEIMNAEMKEDKKNTVFVVKGGSWNSTPFYLQAGVCQFLMADEAHSYLGFRYMLSIGMKE